MKLDSSPITQHTFGEHTFYLKRDDQLHQHFSGNKARKFMSLLHNEYPSINTLIGYGSVQANSLYSLAALCKIKKWSLEFYVQRIPQWLKENPRGNYRGALEMGAKIIEVDSDVHPEQYIQQIRQPDSHCLVIPEGGRCEMAEQGIAGLASEIVNWASFRSHQQLAIALPSGTGTTSYYLQKHLQQHDIQVLTCPCVGGSQYLHKQWQELGGVAQPSVLPCDYKHHFGHLYHNEFLLWQKLHKNTNVEFDLLYDPYMWHALLPWMEQHQDTSVLYIHQGGLLGNETMLPRYQRKFER
ncbi:1-aminocyclopropane-1-carboxylate deaminase/D-cysteine desulfhydrase [Vibrio rarus]|uniref:1-aminocyclopropane-1-carboxylate deaminase/D-cysteine desulfhydrase n=1 Tax=Vibrio rarus TaxID=413403 RepID=UPI0021C26876|nr:1-aminocyclopropane-1-carboxylate deaminase/D-cysteine desulfhydrase [Vibrio rarus]